GCPGADTAELGRQEGLDMIGVPISGRTRTAVTIREESSGTLWHYLEPGPELSEDDRESLRRAFREAAGHCELIALCGSLPSASAEPLVAWMIETGRDLGCRVALDSHGSGLRLGLASRPWLAKPNRTELATA